MEMKSALSLRNIPSKVINVNESFPYWVYRQFMIGLNSSRTNIIPKSRDGVSTNDFRLHLHCDRVFVFRVEIRKR